MKHSKRHFVSSVQKRFMQCFSIFTSLYVLHWFVECKQKTKEMCVTVLTLCLPVYLINAWEAVAGMFNASHHEEVLYESAVYKNNAACYMWIRMRNCPYIHFFRLPQKCCLCFSPCLWSPSWRWLLRLWPPSWCSVWSPWPMCCSSLTA